MYSTLKLTFFICLCSIKLVNGFYLPGIAPVSYCEKEQDTCKVGNLHAFKWFATKHDIEFTVIYCKLLLAFFFFEEVAEALMPSFHQPFSYFNNFFNDKIFVLKNMVANFFCKVGYSFSC